MANSYAAYSTKIIRQQGGSEILFTSGGSANVQSGCKWLFGDSQVLFGTISDPPTVTASPGAIFFRSDGSASNMYYNNGDGSAASVWAAASLNKP